MHFLTIVLNGEPFIRYHLEVFRELPFRWHWHIVEGVAALVRDTAWSVSRGARIEARLHDRGLSVDGTTAYLDEVAAAEPERVSLYRPRPDRFWNGKQEMVSVPLEHIHEECLLWEVDADELWRAEQIERMRNLFVEHPERTAAYYWCNYFVGPDVVIATRYNWAQDPNLEWLRTWRFRPGDRWHAHEPPTLVRSRLRPRDLGEADPFSHEETEAVDAVFQHYAYATEQQAETKESLYGLAGARQGWKNLQEAVAGGGPVLLRDFLPWVEDDTLADAASRVGLTPLATCENGIWAFRSSNVTATERRRDEGVIVVDGVFFQDFSTTGIARVWRSLLQEWLRSGYAKRLLFIERDGAGPRLAGLRTRSLPRWEGWRAALDSLALQQVCDEVGATLFVSTYYTTPIETPSLMVVYDMIPERLRLDMSAPVWTEKRRAVEHASSYVCISENTRRDLLDLEPAAADRPASVALLGVDPVFSPAHEDEIASFRRNHHLERPYLLLVGDRRGVDGYKNGALVFRALGRPANGDTLDVVCVGGAVDVEPEFERLAPRTHTRRLDLTDAELRLAYAGAVALVYPSRYEGFGLPVAEAMASGCPVITTAAASLPEVAGDAAIYIDPDNPQELVEALDEVRRPSRRAEMISAGLRRAADLDWGKVAARYAVVLDQAAVTAGERDAWAELWRARREEQARAEAERLARAPRPRRARRGVPQPAFVRLKSLALRHLPTPAVRALRLAKRRLTGHPGPTR